MSGHENRLLRDRGLFSMGRWRFVPVFVASGAEVAAARLVSLTRGGFKAMRPTAVMLHYAILLCCFAASGAEPKFRLQQSSVARAETFREAHVELVGSARILDLATDVLALYTIDAEGRLQRRAKFDAEPELLARLEFEPACADFAPGAKVLAYASSDGLARLWKLANEKQVLVPLPDDEQTVGVEFAPNGILLACATKKGSVHLWDTTSATFVGHGTTAPGSVQLLAFSPNSCRLAVSPFASELKVFDVAENAYTESPFDETQTIEVGSRVTAMAWLDEARLLVATAEGSLQLVDTNGKKAPVQIARQPCAVWSLAFDVSKSRLAAGSWDGQIRLWATDDWKFLQSLNNHDESVTGLLFDAEGRLLTAGLDGRLRATLPELPLIGASAVIGGRSDSVWVAIHSPNEKQLFVGGRKARFEMWDLETQSLISSREGHNTTRCATYSPDGKFLVTGGDDGKIFVCDTATGDKQRTLEGHPGAISALVFANQGAELVSGCDGKTMKLWNVTTGEELKSWREHKHQIYCAAVSPDDKWLITGGGQWTTGDPGELIIWDLRTGTIKSRLEGHKLAVWSVVFMPDGRRFASSDSSGAVKIWDLESLSEERTLQHSTWVRPLAISSDGSVLAVGRGDGSIRLWDTSSWQQVAACVGHKSFSFHLQFDRTGRLTSSGDDGTVQMWKVGDFPW